MTEQSHPLRPSAAPSRGPSLDTKGPVDLSCLARSRALGPGAACKAHQWTGGAGSTVVAGPSRSARRNGAMT